MKQLLIEKKILKLENEIIEEQMRRIKQYARNELNKMKPTLKKYWECNTSTKRVEIVEAAFALIDSLENELKETKAEK